MANASLVTVGKPKVGGSVFRAPKGTTLPTTATDELDSAFVDMGYISEDGLTNANNRESEEIKDWSGATVLTPQTGKTDTWSLTFIETKNKEVLKAVYGDSNVTGTLETGLTVKVNAKELETAAWVFDMVTTDGDFKRIVIPEGKVSELGEISYQSSEAVGFETTITAFPDPADSDESTHYEYIKKASV